MTNRTIKQRADDAKRMIADATAALAAVQAECTHPKEGLSITPRSNTGNYDPSADSYWKEFDCTLCGKRWTEDQ